MSSNTSSSGGQRAGSVQSNAGAIHVRNLTKVFDTKQGEEVVFEDLAFDIEPGTFVTLIGKSGSGKSTLLKIINGVLDPTAGEVTFEAPDGTISTDPTQGVATDDGVTIGQVFQDPRLLPWNTCVRNIEYVHEQNSDYTDELAREYLDMVGLGDHYDKYPTQLSGGQRQRVGIARAFSIDPEILLMDEPFSNLDEITAEELRTQLLEIWEDLHKTIFFVTHDITEAIVLSDRILMLGDGRIYDDIDVELDRPRDIDSEAFLRFRQDAIDRFHAID